MPGKPPRVVYEDVKDKYTGITKLLQAGIVLIKKMMGCTEQQTVLKPSSRSLGATFTHSVMRNAGLIKLFI